MTKYIKCTVINKEHLKLLVDILFSFHIIDYYYNPVSDVISIGYKTDEGKEFVNCIIESTTKEIVEEY